MNNFDEKWELRERYYFCIIIKLDLIKFKLFNVGFGTGKQVDLAKIE